MGKIIYKSKEIIKFTNTKATRVGKGIKMFRMSRLGMSIEQFADEVGIDPSYLNRLEDGYEPEVEMGILELIANTVGVCKRGNGLSADQLVNLFLYATKDDPPVLI